MSHSSDAPSAKTQVKRGRKRACYEPQRVRQIIDASLLCHVSQSIHGQPVVTPTCHWRDGDRLYWHGHAKARNVSDGRAVCINICQLNGLVLARSAFHHSVNYQSVTLFGTPELVSDREEKLYQLERFVDKVSPGRWSQLRPVTEQELMLTAIAWVPISEASVKMRDEPPIDDEADYNWPVWAGVLPLERTWGKAQADPRLRGSEWIEPVAPDSR
ncbi:pyridoxamine 5'-phosphate oxidase family protein [Lacimicrobium alkaliphilum]|uniref:Flavin-nucleotide-binding protein n=1 Tax=Lacimicrobium alkaliphilum TaxID=1526571 RepID=A0A0U3AX09_9ALTE|nr:pyridoxamine 5'-phosphate oxidase family protein [Lacimicrobium alkaliphilum]ALS97440.1 flavin-nucleotide-binding protein [Lacimicrobium alkaliphilum]